MLYTSVVGILPAVPTSGGGTVFLGGDLRGGADPLFVRRGGDSLCL